MSENLQRWADSQELALAQALAREADLRAKLAEAEGCISDLVDLADHRYLIGLNPNPPTGEDMAHTICRKPGCEMPGCASFDTARAFLARKGGG